MTAGDRFTYVDPTQKQVLEDIQDAIAVATGDLGLLPGVAFQARVAQLAQLNAAHQTVSRSVAGGLIWYNLYWYINLKSCFEYTKTHDLAFFLQVPSLDIVGFNLFAFKNLTGYSNLFSFCVF